MPFIFLKNTKNLLIFSEKAFQLSKKCKLNQETNDDEQDSKNQIRNDKTFMMVFDIFLYRLMTPLCTGRCLLFASNAAPIKLRMIRATPNTMIKFPMAKN